MTVANTWYLAHDSWRRPVARALFYASMVAAVLVALPGAKIGYNGYALPKEIALHAVALGMVLVLAVRRRPVELDRIDLALGASLLLGALSAASAINGWMALRSFELSLSGVIVFCGARQLARGGDGRVLLAAAGLAAVASAAVVLLESSHVLDSLSMHGRGPGGLAGNRNFAAHLGVLGAPLLAYLAIVNAGRLQAAAWCAGLSVVSASVLLSRCRAAWLAAFVLGAMVAAGVVLWRVSGSRGARAGGRAFACVLAVVVGVLLALVVPNQLEWRDDRPYRQTLGELTAFDRGTGKGRILQYRNTLSLIAQRPLLGVGPGNWSVGYMQVASRIDPNVRRSSPQPVNRLPNTDWLGTAAERGLPALAAWWLAGLLLLHLLWRRVKSGALEVRPRAAAATAMMSALLVMGTFDAVLLRAETLLIAALALGALSSPSSAPAARRVGRHRGPLLVVAALLAALSTLDTSRLLASELVRKHQPLLALRLDPGNYTLPCSLALRAAREGQCPRALRYAHAAMVRFPGLPACRRVVATCTSARARPR